MRSATSHTWKKLEKTEGVVQQATCQKCPLEMRKVMVPGTRRANVQAVQFRNGPNGEWQAMKQRPACDNSKKVSKPASALDPQIVVIGETTPPETVEAAKNSYVSDVLGVMEKHHSFHWDEDESGDEP